MKKEEKVMTEDILTLSFHRDVYDRLSEERKRETLQELTEFIKTELSKLEEDKK